MIGNPVDDLIRGKGLDWGKPAFVGGRESSILNNLRDAIRGSFEAEPGNRFGELEREIAS